MPTELPPREKPDTPFEPQAAPPDGGHTPRDANNLDGKPPPARSDGGAIALGTLAGIPIRLHVTFLLLLAWIGFVSVSDRVGSKAGQGWSGLALIVGLFGCVLLHELGHALVARRYGIRTRDITLYPIGGVARLENLPRPRQELWIALAGPLVNVALAGLLFVILKAANIPIGRFHYDGAQGGFGASLLWANVALAVFNLIPAFPMDGGRILRALLARSLDEVTATQTAARIGQALAFGFGIYGLLRGDLFLVFIAFFVYSGAGQEAAAFTTRALVTGHRAREAMLDEFRTLTNGNTLREAGDALLAGSQQDFPVVHGDEVLGVLSRSALMRGYAQEGADSYVAGAMQREFAWARPDDSLDSVMTIMQLSGNGPVLVMEGASRETARLVGMITQENLLEFMMLTQLQSRGQARQ